MDKKLIIFLVLFFAFFFAYQKFVIDPMVKKQPVAKKTAPAAAQPSATQKSIPEAKAPQTSPPVEPTVPPAGMAVESTSPTIPTTPRSAVVDTPLYRAEFRNTGAVLTSFRLKKYTDDFNKPLEMVPQIKETDRLPMSLDFDRKELAKVASEALYAIDKETVNLSGGESGAISFTYSDGRNVIRKTFSFRADSYILGMKVDAKENGQPVAPRVVWAPGIEDASSYKDASALRESEGLIHNGEKVERKKTKDIEQFQKVAATVRWAGVENNYFAAIFVPSAAADAYMYPPPPDTKRVALSIAEVQPAAASEYKVFIGPKDYMLLKDLGNNLEDAVDFGFWLGPIVKGLFIGLRMLHDYTKNYGWAIVLLTVLIKIIFTPFMQKSFASQKKMQAMQPEMKKIQEKYAKMKNDDPRKQSMNQEIMGLHKRYGVNPLGGCLPMIVQMPVLIAFYSLLSGAIELRKAPFMLWIHDLSRPDPFYVLPLLMGASMFVQQRLTPISDPMQKNMMYIMPVMFTFMSFKLQSGLVLYWLLSNLLGLLHQYLFTKQQSRVAVAVREGNA